MHGCGNDYIYINCIEKMARAPEKLARIASDRHFGIGSDGLILICGSDIADFKMVMYNADGSEGKMCGNGIRCVAKYVYDTGLTDKKSISIETKSGVKHIELTVEGGEAVLARVDMGAPVLTPSKIPAAGFDDREKIVGETVYIDGKEYKITCVSMGNPHVVIFMENIKELDIEGIGPKLERHPMFPDGANVEFVRLIERGEMDVRVWERGSNETLACGTGACAAVVASVLNGFSDGRATVHLLGGDLSIDYDAEKETVWMTGPAAKVFDGEFKYDA